MPPSHDFHHRPLRRRGVSELYASMMMLGVTLTMGGLVASAAIGQLGLQNGSASMGAALAQESAGKDLALVYLVAAPSGSCPVYAGYHEGTTLTLAVYNYGTERFAPSALAINGTVYAGGYSAVGPGSLGTFALSLGSCAHASGETVLLVDSVGDEVQLAS